MFYPRQDVYSQELDTTGKSETVDAFSNEKLLPAIHVMKINWHFNAG